MARSAANKAEQAADALEAFLRTRPAAVVDGPRSEVAAVGPQEGAVGAHRVLPAVGPMPERVPIAFPTVPSAAPLRLPHNDWLAHRLTVTGPTVLIAAFRTAASGAGTIPWHLDLESLEEDWFHLLIRPPDRELSLAGARVLAGQLRDAVERRHALAVARVGHSRACPFDLHALVPVPAAILHFGPNHPDALAWLWQHWGTTQALRHVAPDTAPAKLPTPPAADGENKLELRFWSADWTPWRAFERVRADWPTLRFDVQPDYTAC